MPFYWLCPGWAILLFLQTVYLGLAAIPMYLIARHLFQQHRVAMLFTIGFMLVPPIVSQNVNQVEEPSFLLVFLLAAFYFFVTERFGWFLAFAFLACLGRENVSLAVVMFGIYALLLRRHWKWVVTPVVLGGVYFWLALFVLIPSFRPGVEWHAVRMFSHLGDNPKAIVLNCLTNPALVIRHMTGGDNLSYVLTLVQPVGWVLPFFSGAALLALPDLAINTLSNNGALKVIPWHYNVITGSFLFIGAMYSLRKLADRVRPRCGGQPEVVLAVVLTALCAAHWFLWFSPRCYVALPYHATLERALARVPADKSLVAPLRLQVHIGNREHYQNTGIFASAPEYAAQFEYVLLDANERQYMPVITREFFEQFRRNPNYQLIFAEQNVFVFQRLGGESDWKVLPPR